jgi:nucleoside-diphosphate-sugar epimerase
MTSVLITGGSGLIGSFLSDNLTTTKKIIVLIREKRVPNIKYSSLVCPDLNKITVEEICEIYKKHDITHIVHCAGVKNVISDKEYNLNAGVIEKFLQADEEKSRHFIVFGSVAEYGMQEGGVVEETTECHPSGRYASSKLEQTQLCEKYFKRGYKVNVIRLSNPFLPKLPKSSFIGASLYSLQNDIPLLISNPSVQRDFVDGRDLVRFVDQLINSVYIPQATVNFGLGVNLTYKYLIDKINKTLGKFEFKNILRYIVTNQIEDYSKARISTSLLKETFNYKTRYTLDDTLEWILKLTDI